MAWIFLAIAAHFFWALINILDKYVVMNKVRDPYVYLVWQVIAGGALIVLLPFFDLEILLGRDLIVLLFISAFAFVGGMLYLRAMQTEDVTRINIWWNIIPVYTLLLGLVFLGEKLSFLQSIAFLLLISGAVLASFHWQKGMIRISRAFWLMLVACFFYALYAIGMRYLSQRIDFYSLFWWLHIIMFLYVPFLFLKKKFRASFVAETSRLNKGLLLIVGVVVLLGILGTFFNIWALSLGPAALVFVMEGWQVLFVFVLTLFISAIKPEILQEELDKRNMIFKISAAVLMVIGVVLIYLD